MYSFVTVTIYSRMTNIDQNIFEAAKDLGASDLIILFALSFHYYYPFNCRLVIEFHSLLGRCDY